MKLNKENIFKTFFGVSLFLFSLICFLSLISFNINDQSWFYYDNNNLIINNKLGFLGSNIASILLYFLGTASIILVFFFAYLSILLIKNIKLKSEIERIFAFLLITSIFASLFDYYKICLFDCYNGGLFGKIIFKKVAEKFGKNIALILFYNSLYICLILITRFNFVWMITNKFNYKLLNFIFNILIKLKNFIFVPINKIYSKLIDKNYRNLDNLENNNLEELLFDLEYAQLDVKQNQKLEQDLILDNYLEVKQIKQEILPDLNNIFNFSQDNQEDKKLIKESQIQAKVLEEKLKCFGISGSVVSIKHGPVITLFEYEPQINSKISKIIALEDDLAMALEAISIRIIAPIPGKSVIGFEIANKFRKNVLMSEIIKSDQYKNFPGQLPLILGQDVIGNKIIIDLVKAPHLLIAGSTGSGKSVALNTMIISLLCKNLPNQLKLILIDPKRLEFSAYSDIGHLLFPIITSAKQANSVLKWLTKEMENRYEIMAQINAKNILDCKEKFPFIVLIIDELADLMMTGGKEIEDSITRIAQMARACGIHMIIATQRPSVDVITGLIKVNFPSRISFKVASKIDSRTILDCSGADKLLGKGDMLFLNSQSSYLQRVHGAYVSDQEILKTVEHIKSQFKVSYLDLTEIFSSLNQEESHIEDDLYKDIILFLKNIDEVSISLLQRKFKIGYNRSARIIELLENQGYILPSASGKPRKVIKAQK